MAALPVYWRMITNKPDTVNLSRYLDKKVPPRSDTKKIHLEIKRDSDSKYYRYVTKRNFSNTK